MFIDVISDAIQPSPALLPSSPAFNLSQHQGHFTLLLPYLISHNNPELDYYH